MVKSKNIINQIGNRVVECSLIFVIALLGHVIISSNQANQNPVEAIIEASTICSSIKQHLLALLQYFFFSVITI